MTKIQKKFLRERRRGSGLLLALFVTLIGGAIVVMMFGMSASFLNVSVHQSRVYSDGIRAESFLEDVKGNIIAANNLRSNNSQPVWHSPSNDPLAKFEGNDAITASGELEFANFEIPLTPVENRMVAVKVFDALYKPDRIASSFVGFEDLSPSFFVASSGGTSSTGSTGESYGSESVGGFSPEEIYNKYGVYVIQVKIFPQGGSNPAGDNWVRKTEEAFAFRVP